jgi:hypothetical protein
MGLGDIQAKWHASSGLALLALLVAYTAFGGCARLPYTTKVLYQDRRVVINAQQELGQPAYTHPAQLSPAEVASILAGFSAREQQRLPLRWFAEEVPPKAAFRADEIEVLAPYLADALTQVGPNERVHFELIGPGFNPSMEKDALSGWVAVRDPYLYFTLEYFHIQVPTRSSDPYDYNYPTPAPLPRNYLLYFEPGRFWVTDQNGRRAVEYRSFLKSAPSLSGAGTAAPSAPAGAP